MGSPAQWGKLTNFQAGLRKPALIAFGTFSPNDNLTFITDIPANPTPQATIVPIAYSSALVIDTSRGSIFEISLTGDVASTVLNYGGSSSIPTGLSVQLRYKQDATGGRTVVLPANLVKDAGFAVDGTASTTTVLPIFWNGTNWTFGGIPFSVTGA